MGQTQNRSYLAVLRAAADFVQGDHVVLAGRGGLALPLGGQVHKVQRLACGKRHLPVVQEWG